LLSLVFFDEANSKDNYDCVVTKQDIEGLTNLHEQSLAGYLSWLGNQEYKITYPELGEKFTKWENRELGTSFSSRELRNSPPYLKEDYLFDYVEFTKLASGCGFHDDLNADKKNIRKSIIIHSSVYRSKNEYYVTSTPTLQF